MKYLILIAIACLVGACVATPAGQYTVAQVDQGLKDAAASGIISSDQAAAVGGKIAVAHPGIAWAEILGGVGSVVASLGLGYLGLKPALRRTDNRHIIGEEEAAAIGELVAKRRG